MIQKSFQFDQRSKDGIDQDLRLVKNLNNLSSSTDYEKKYIIYYGYKFEDPTVIYQLNHDKNEVGKELNIRKYNSNGKTSTVKKLTPGRSVSTKKIAATEHMADISANLKTQRSVSPRPVRKSRAVK